MVSVKIRVKTFDSDSSARAGNEIKIPYISDNGDKQHEYIIATSAYVVHPAYNQRYRRQKFYNAKQREQRNHYYTEYVYSRRKTGQTYYQKY